jgi:putative flippase GtrA
MFAFVVSFSLQKFWTFDERSIDSIHTQLGMYLILALFGLGANTVAMYVLVDHAGFHYLAAQILASAFIAVGNFFAYKHFIFTGVPPTLSSEKKQ